MSAMLEEHVFLIGMPGSGKSSLGKKAAANLQLPFVDMDALIEEAVGLSIPDIFAVHGEQAFRNAETNTLISLASREPSVVSTGGGAVLSPENRSLMRNQGVIVLIDRPLEQILSDIRLDRRPLLAKKGLEEVKRLYGERIDIYRSVCDLCVTNDASFYEGVRRLQDAITSLAGADNSAAE